MGERRGDASSAAACYAEAARGELRLAVRVQPRSSHSRVAGVHGERLKVQVTAPPVDGAANRAVVDVIAAWLGVPRRVVRIASGESAREKVIAVEVDDPVGWVRRVVELVGG